MFSYLIRRILQSVVVLLVVSLIIFVVLYYSGDPIELLLPHDATQQQVDDMRAYFGLDQPLINQYFIFLRNAVHGDLGRSFIFNRPALELVLERLPATLEMALLAMGLALALAVPAGLLSGVKPNSWPARFIMPSSLIGISIPTFWLGIMLVLVFSVLLGWLPSSGRGETVSVLGVRLSLFTLDGLRHLILPATTIAVFQLALLVRLVRAGTVEIMMEDFIKFLRAKGIGERRVVYIHVLKNIMIPVVTMVGLQLCEIIAFSIIIESIFAWPGMGKLLIDSIHNLDRPVVVAYLLFISFILVLVNFLVDMIYSLLDPRIRLG